MRPKPTSRSLWPLQNRPKQIGYKIHTSGTPAIKPLVIITELKDKEKIFTKWLSPRTDIRMKYAVCREVHLKLEIYFWFDRVSRTAYILYLHEKPMLNAEGQATNDLEYSKQTSMFWPHCDSRVLPNSLWYLYHFKVTFHIRCLPDSRIDCVRPPKC